MTILNSCDSLEEMTANLESPSQGVALYPEGVALYPEGVALYPQGIAPHRALPCVEVYWAFSP